MLFLQMEHVLVPAPAIAGLSCWSLPTAHTGRCSPHSRLLDFLLWAVSLGHDPSHHLWTGLQSNFSYTFAFWRETLFGGEESPFFGSWESSNFSVLSHKSAWGYSDIFSWWCSAHNWPLKEQWDIKVSGMEFSPRDSHSYKLRPPTPLPISKAGRVGQAHTAPWRGKPGNATAGKGLRDHQLSGNACGWRTAGPQGGHSSVFTVQSCSFHGNTL